MAELIQLFGQTDTYISLITLTLMEIVLGVDNVIFISIIVAKLPASQQNLARTLGLGLALGFRILLLLCISWIVGLVEPFFSIAGHGVSGRDIILMAGGLFLVAKSTLEIHHKLEGEEGELNSNAYPKFWNIVAQIAMLDLVFSFDSVITAVGLVREIPIMVIAVVLSLLVMLAFSGKISAIIHEHPTLKMLALSFLLMIGTLLFAEGLHFHVPKGYVYFAMSFSLSVELLNMKMRKKFKPVKLREQMTE
ncbi:MAG: TerC family protein [Oligoflexia bacterium]|nr:TerC family protein [Oligoflexia bacterium]